MCLGHFWLPTLFPLSLQLLFQGYIIGRYYVTIFLLFWCGSIGSLLRWKASSSMLGWEQNIQKYPIYPFGSLALAWFSAISGKTWSSRLFMRWLIHAVRYAPWNVSKCFRNLAWSRCIFESRFLKFLSNSTNLV